MQSTPIMSRLDPLTRSSMDLSPLCCSIPALSGPGLRLDSPLFTRLTLDSALTPSVQEKLIPELHMLGTAWVSGRKTDERQLQQIAGSTPKIRSQRIVPLQIDEPIDVDLVEHAAAVEFQMYGLPFHSVPGSRLARWTPNVPVEISDYEQLGKKVECLKVLSAGKCVIGAAVCPGAVYEDVRFLLDCGFDFLTLLCHVRSEFNSAGGRDLAPLEFSVEKACKAISDAGSPAKLLLSADLHSGSAMFEWLEKGVSAVSMDAYLANLKPVDPAPSRESYGSVLSYATPQVSTFSWVRTAVSKLITELQDCQIYSRRGTVA